MLQMQYHISNNRLSQKVIVHIARGNVAQYRVMPVKKIMPGFVIIFLQTLDN